jgi:hypothetical protein
LPGTLAAWYWDSTAFSFKYTKKPDESEAQRIVDWLLDPRAPGAPLGVMSRFSSIEISQAAIRGRDYQYCRTFEAEFKGELNAYERSGEFLFLDKIGTYETEACRDYLYRHPNLLVPQALQLAVFAEVLHKIRDQISRAYFLTVNPDMGRLAVEFATTVFTIETRHLDPRTLTIEEARRLRAGS